MNRIEAIRNAIGENPDILIEAHGRFDSTTAINIASELKRFSPMWFEEPVPEDDLRSMAEVKAKSPVPIATGERYRHEISFPGAPLFESSGHHPPDVCHVGGIREITQIAAMAEVNYVSVAPHNPNGPIATAATLNALITMPNALILEFWVDAENVRRDLIKEYFDVRDGYVYPSNKPGLGITVQRGRPRQISLRKAALRVLWKRLQVPRQPEEEKLSPSPGGHETHQACCSAGNVGICNTIGSNSSSLHVHESIAMRLPDSRAVSKRVLACVVSIIVIAISTGAYVNYSSSTLTAENASTFTVTTVENQTVTTTITTTVYMRSSTTTSVTSYSTTYPSPVIPKNSSTEAVTVNRNSSLELVMMINATTIKSGQDVDIEYYFANPANQNITLNSVWKFAAPGTNDTYCGNLVGPAVYAGVYTGQNVSEATPLVLLNPDYGVSCSIGTHASSYRLLADSGTSPSFFPILR